MKRHAPESIETLVRAMFEALGCPSEIATAGASSLVAADLTGHGSQGVLRVPWIGEKIRRSEVDPAARPTVDRVGDAVAMVDGRSGVGQFVAKSAVDTAVELATERGVGVVGLRNANDLGRVGEWAELATTENLVFECLVNGRAHPTVAPNGCADRILSTNPIAFGIPTFGALEFPIVLDMATSQTAQGTIEEYDQQRRELPPEWTTTRTGAPVADPQAFLEGSGAILPLGGRVSGYKGFGLGIVNELLAGTLSGGTVAGQSDRPPSGNDAVFIAIDPTSFVPAERFAGQLSAFVSFLRSRDCASAVEVGVSSLGPDGHLPLPGERSYRTRIERTESGLPLPAKTVEGLQSLAVELDCVDLVPDSFPG